MSLKDSFFLTDQEEEAYPPEQASSSERRRGAGVAMHPRLKRGVYLLPNSLTIASLFAGFYAIVAAMRGYFDLAAIGVFVAMMMDFFDGRVARLTHTQSAFGAQLDSLADMVSFGVTPALVTYSWSLYQLGKFGWLAAFLFVAAGALRLARFNTQVSCSEVCSYFQGLPTPSAAGLLASFVWISVEGGVSNQPLAIPAAVMTVLTAVLMVSNLRYQSFKQLNLRGRVPFRWILAVVLALVGIALNPPVVLFLLFLAYALSGPILSLCALRKEREVK